MDNLPEKSSLPSYMTVNSHWLHRNDDRLDATAYSDGAISALIKIESSGLKTRKLGECVGDIFHPTDSKSRSHFKRIWSSREKGIPFLTGKQLFFFRPARTKFVSKKMSSIDELLIPQDTIIISRSGSTGYPVIVNEWLAKFAITDDAIRVYPGDTPIGYIYAFLASDIGRRILISNEYGSTVSHLEAKHVSNMILPLLSDSKMNSIHDDIIESFAMRAECNSLLDLAEERLYDLTGLTPLTEDEIDFIDNASGIKSFSARSVILGDRLDASHHLPIMETILARLDKGKCPHTSLKEICEEIKIPARFKRNFSISDKGTPYLLPSQLTTFKARFDKFISRKQSGDLTDYILQEGQLLLTTDGTVGRTHPVTRRMTGWFGSNNMARLSDKETDMGFLYTYLSLPYGYMQLQKDIYGSVVDHINEAHIGNVRIPKLSTNHQMQIGDIVRRAFNLKDLAAEKEDKAIEKLTMSIEKVR